MRRLSIAAALFTLMLSAIVRAQNPTSTITYDFDASLSEVQSYTQALTLDGTAIATPPTCMSQQSNLTTCSVAVPALASGPHSVGILVSRNNMSTELKLNGIDTAQGPKTPKNTRYNITININIP